VSAADDIKGLVAKLRQEGEFLGRQPELGDAFLRGTRIFKAADALEALSAKLDAALKIIGAVEPLLGKPRWPEDK